MKKYILIILCGWLAACSRPITTPDGSLAIPVRLAKPSYAIDVFFDNQEVPKSYVAIGEVKVSQEVLLSKQQTTKQGRMINRGNNEEQKRALLDQLILQATSKGANAVAKVKYKYYTAIDYQGFMMEGVAIKYTLD
jgi:uncharacterized protein YbjQ (UPF0145 family)